MTEEHATPSRRILVVEDESAQRLMYEKALTRMGFGVTLAASISQARQALTEHSFAVVLLDLNLGGESGMDYFEELREAHPATSVVIATGYGTLDAASRAIRMDVVDFLSKPVALDDLEKAVERAWSRCKKVQAPVSSIQPSALDDDAKAIASRRSLNIEQAERDLIFEALRRCQDNRKAAASMLGISERTLYYRLSLYM
ncbi:MAG: response regulator [Phycisphaerales bacterium]